MVNASPLPKITISSGVIVTIGNACEAITIGDSALLALVDSAMMLAVMNATISAKTRLTTATNNVEWAFCQINAQLSSIALKTTLGAGMDAFGPAMREATSQDVSTITKPLQANNTLVNILFFILHSPLIAYGLRL